jgi:hypothetical protein
MKISFQIVGVAPPSIRNVDPVMNSLSGLTMKQTVAAHVLRLPPAVHPYINGHTHIGHALKAHAAGELPRHSLSAAPLRLHPDNDRI